MLEPDLSRQKTSLLPSGLLLRSDTNSIHEFRDTTESLNACVVIKFADSVNCLPGMFSDMMIPRPKEL